MTVEQLQDLADRMKRARFGVLFFGMGLSMTRGKHMNSASVLTLVTELNAFTKFVAMPMRGHGNVTGADMVLRWTTGYPFGVNLSRGYPRFNPGEFSTVDLLVRGDNDAALILGADPGATMPQPGIEHLTRIPTIVLDPKVTHTSRLARVHITTAATGISAPGTVYRMDEVPLPLRPALRSPYPTDEEVLRRIRQAVAAKPAWTPAANGTPLVGVGPMLRITGGKVYDPANRIDGEVQDVCIADGRIVSRGRGRPHDRRHRHGRLPRRRRRRTPTWRARRSTSPAP